MGFTSDLGKDANCRCWWRTELGLWWWCWSCGLKASSVILPTQFGIQYPFPPLLFTPGSAFCTLPPRSGLFLALWEPKGEEDAPILTKAVQLRSSEPSRNLGVSVKGGRWSSCGLDWVRHRFGPHVATSCSAEPNGLQRNVDFITKFLLHCSRENWKPNYKKRTKSWFV